MRLTETGTGTGTVTTVLSRDCVIMRPPFMFMHPPLISICPFYPDDGSIPLCHMLPSDSTE